MNTSPWTRAQAPGAAAARRALVAVVLAAALALPAAAAVYKWVDAQGRVHYSDLPPPPDGKLLSVDTTPHGKSERGGPEPAGRPAAPMPAAASVPPAAPGTTPEAAARLKQSVEADVATARTEQCKQAQEKYQKYVQSRRLYKEGPNKERIYLSDQELDTERLQAKHEVDEFCAGR